MVDPLLHSTFTNRIEARLWHSNWHTLSHALIHWGNDQQVQHVQGRESAPDRTLKERLGTRHVFWKRPNSPQEAQAPVPTAAGARGCQDCTREAEGLARSTSEGCFRQRRGACDGSTRQIGLTCSRTAVRWQ